MNRAIPIGGNMVTEGLKQFILFALPGGALLVLGNAATNAVSDSSKWDAGLMVALVGMFLGFMKWQTTQTTKAQDKMSRAIQDLSNAIWGKRPRVSGDSDDNHKV